MMKVASIAMFRMGGYEKLLADMPNLLNDASKELMRAVMDDAVRNCGVGAQIDCQQGLSPLYAVDPVECTRAYRQIQAPVQLWYGSKDGSVPIETAQWLENTIPNAALHVRPVGHGLYFYHAPEVLDSMLPA